MDPRQALVEAGVDLLVESGPAPGVDHVRMADAAHRAGYTSGAAYRYWPNQHEFQRDVIIAALRLRAGSAVADTVAMIRRLVEDGAPFSEIIRVGSAANLHRWPDDAVYFATLALRSATYADEDLRDVSKERLVAGLDEYVDLYEAMLRLSDRRMRPPFTTRHLALLFGALGEGFTLQASLGLDHPCFPGGAVDGGSADAEAVERDWTLLAIAVRALVEELTEPLRATPVTPATQVAPLP
jgi:AcrR family transcriptional regulator